MKNTAIHFLRKQKAIITTASGFLSLLILLLGCQSSPPPAHSYQPPAPPVSAPTDHPSALSYGSIMTVKKGITTQEELLTQFGGPNIMTMDANGVETWVYEKSASQSKSSELVRTFMNQDSKGDEKTITTTSSIKTLTVIIKFNSDKTVKDYSVRAAYF